MFPEHAVWVQVCQWAIFVPQSGVIAGVCLTTSPLWNGREGLFQEMAGVLLLA